MFGGGRGEAPKDLSVARVEAILGLVAGSGSAAPQALEGTPVVTNAVWICACVTFDEAPTWLIHDGDDRVSWHRVPDGVEPLDLVQAQRARVAMPTLRRSCAGSKAKHMTRGETAGVARVMRPRLRNSGAGSGTNSPSSAGRSPQLYTHWTRGRPTGR